MSKHTGQRGFSVVEAMVALVAGLVVIGSVLAFTVATVRSNAENVQATRLAQELRALMNLVTRDVRRAGYDDLSIERVGIGTAAVSPHSRMQIATLGDADTGCVAFSYDRTGNTAGVREDAELRAYRRTEINGVGVLQMRTGAGTSCNANAGWQTLSDPNAVHIRRFGVTLNTVDAPTGPGTAPIRVRDIDLDLEGNLLTADDTVRAIQSRIRVRADCVRDDLNECDSL